MNLGPLNWRKEADVVCEDDQSWTFLDNHFSSLFRKVLQARMKLAWEEIVWASGLLVFVYPKKFSAQVLIWQRKGFEFLSQHHGNKLSCPRNMVQVPAPWVLHLLHDPKHPKTCWPFVDRSENSAFQPSPPRKRIDADYHIPHGEKTLFDEIGWRAAGQAVRVNSLSLRL